MRREQEGKTMGVGGIAGWLLGRLRLGGAQPARRRLELVERIAIAPRQQLALVEAEGRRFLVATSPEGAPVFYPLDGAMRHRSEEGFQSELSMAVVGGGRARAKRKGKSALRAAARPSW